MSQAPASASVPSRPTVGGEDPGTQHVADVLAAAALATPGVVGLHGGRFGEIGTYLPGRRVVGVRVGPEVDLGPGLGRGRGSVEVHVVVEPSSLPGVGDAVREAVAPHAGDRDVHVVVADVLDPVEQAAEREAAEREAAEREAAEREAAERQAAERQAAERETAEREATEPEAAEGDVPEPDAPGSSGSTPDDGSRTPLATIEVVVTEVGPSREATDAVPGPTPTPEPSAETDRPAGREEHTP